ncbi:MAG: hypothetical protein QNJ40_24070 [Xanthomonadales bacterium]|nr:hypothetical protein [Xanthomonadales bacterium]
MDWHNGYTPHQQSPVKTPLIAGLKLLNGLFQAAARLLHYRTLRTRLVASLINSVDCGREGARGRGLFMARKQPCGCG